MKRILLVAASFMLLFAPLAHADTIDTYTTVDDFSRTQSFRFSVTGLLNGGMKPMTKDYHNYSGGSGDGYNFRLVDACERAALMMMNRPGRFVLEIDVTYSDYVTCRLKKQ